MIFRSFFFGGVAPAHADLFINPSPACGRGRPYGQKIIGLLKAVEIYVNQDHAAEMRVWEQRVAHVIETLSPLDHVLAWRQLPRGVGQQIPHAAVAWDEVALNLTHEEAVQALRNGSPRIAVQVIDPSRSSGGTWWCRA